MAGKTHSVHELVERVLREHHPSQARESLLWLGGGQLRLTDLAEEPETAFALHDVVRIRAIGVYAVDKRFVGYITKDEGKPLTGHVLRCCTTGLMLTFLSELRRACEVQFQSRGGSLYEELSIEDCKEAQVPQVIEVSLPYCARVCVCVCEVIVCVCVSLCTCMCVCLYVHTHVWLLVVGYGLEVSWDGMVGIEFQDQLGGF